MAKKEKIYTGIEIIDFADKGQAIGRSSSGEIFLIPGPVPGDRVTVSVRRKKKGMKLGRVMEFEALSQDRQIPFCDHFNICGGCKWQHFDYFKQAEFKEKQVRETLFRIGGIARSLEYAIIKAEETRYFRNKMEYSFSNKRWLTETEIQSGEEITQRNALGFHRPGQFDKIVDIERCFLQDEFANKIRNYVKWYCLKKQYAFFDIRAQEGLLRNLTIRNTRLGDWMLILSFYRDDQLAIQDILNELVEKFPEIKSLYYVINSKGNDSIFDLPVKLFHGEEFIREKLGEVKYKIGPKSFFQTNPVQAEKLFQKLKEILITIEPDVVYDLYCGLGSISLFIADICKRVIGIETLEAAVEEAKENARYNKIENVNFFAAKVEDLFNSQFVKKIGLPEVIIVDPPRAGLHKSVVESIVQSNVAHLIYVSCNPSTQARDLQLLSENYDCKIYQAVDMFPHSHHVENIAYLERKSK